MTRKILFEDLPLEGAATVQIDAGPLRYGNNVHVHRWNNLTQENKHKSDETLYTNRAEITKYIKWMLESGYVIIIKHGDVSKARLSKFLKESQKQEGNTGG